MKISINKITVVGCLSLCLSSIAQASWEPDVILTGPYFPDITCDSAPSNINIVVVENLEDVPIIIGNAEIINKDGFSDALITVDSGVLSTCPVTNEAPLGAGQTCDINLIITPAACPPSGSIIGEVDRELVLFVDTWQQTATLDIEFAYVEGIPQPPAKDTFAILGGSVTNNIGTSYVIGNVGYTDTSSGVYGLFDVTGTLFDNAPPLDPFVIDAQNGFTDEYNQLNSDRLNYGCRSLGNLDGYHEVTASSYCLSNATDSAVEVGGIVHLIGPGQFVFFTGDPIDKNANCISDDYTNPDLVFEADTRFIYTNASPADVTWVIGNCGTVTLTAGAAVAGTILAGEGFINGDPNSGVPATVHGRLWSNFYINLYGESVSIP